MNTKPSADTQIEMVQEVTKEEQLKDVRQHLADFLGDPHLAKVVIATLHVCYEDENDFRFFNLVLDRVFSA